MTTNREITDKEKVLAVYPDARFCPSYLDRGMIISGESGNYKYHGTSWGETNEAAAWIVAAARLPNPAPSQTESEEISGGWSVPVPVATPQLSEPDHIVDAHELVSEPEGAEATKQCGQHAGSLNPRLGLNYACVLPEGHEGEHRRGGTCFKHGRYVGENCPDWPNCANLSPKSSPIAEGELPELEEFSCDWEDFAAARIRRYAKNHRCDYPGAYLALVTELGKRENQLRERIATIQQQAEEMRRMEVACGLSCEMHGCSSPNCTTHGFLERAEKLFADLKKAEATVKHLESTVKQQAKIIAEINNFMRHKDHCPAGRIYCIICGHTYSNCKCKKFTLEDCNCGLAEISKEQGR